MLAGQPPPACEVACHTAHVTGNGDLAYIHAETIPPGGAPALPASGGWHDGVWAISWSRPLRNSNPYDLQFDDLDRGYGFFVKVFQRRSRPARPCLGAARAEVCAVSELANQQIGESTNQRITRNLVIRHSLIRHSPFAICTLLILLFTVYFSWLAITRHMMFRSSAMDLGYTTQVVWNTLHGRPFEFSTYENAPIDLPLEQFKRTDNLLGYHVELLLAPISLLYLIYASPVTLLVLQVIGVALGALPAFWLARRRLASGFAGLAFAAAYLLAPALNGAVLSDFHAVSLTAALFLFAFYFLEEQRPWAFLAMVVIALSAKEDVPLLVFMLGLYLIFWRRQRPLGIATALLGLGWFLVATRVIQPHFNGLPASPFLTRMAIFGPTIEATIRNALADPRLVLAWLTRGEVLTYLSGLAATGGFLSLFSPLTAAIGAPILAINIFSNWDWTYSEGAHYSASLIPFVIVSAIYGAEFVAYQAARRTRLCSGPSPSAWPRSS